MGNIAHCNAGGAGNCNADSAEQCSGPINIIQRREYETFEIRDAPTNGTFIPGPAEFRTFGGVLLAAPHGGTIGQAIHNPVAINATQWAQDTENHPYDEEAGLEQFDYITDNMRTEVDYIKEVVWQGTPKM